MSSTATVGGASIQRIGLWAGAPNDLHLVAIGDSPAQGVPNRDFDYFTSLRFNSADQVAFMGFLESDSDEQRLSDAGIWAGAAVANGIKPIALEGRQAPGFEPGVVFRGSAPGDVVSYSAFGNPVLSGDGHVAFAATVFGSGIDFDHNDGVWVSDPVSESGKNLTLVAREGDHPPGTPAGTRFAGIFTGDDLIRAFEHPSLNSAGQIAFEALTTGPLGESGRGIWATDTSGNLRLLTHTGTEIDVAPGDTREIALLKLHAGGSSEEGYLSPFNDAGQLAFAVSFADGSEAVVVASIVPELSTFFMTLMTVCIAMLRGGGMRRFHSDI